MPIAISKAVEVGVPMSLVKQAAERELIAFIEFELIKLSTMVNIDARLNLQSHQVPLVAQSLYEDFKYESMEDIAICLRRGAMGRYDEKGIFRIDGAVISQWMSRYLEEKYQVVEDNLAKEKVNPAPHTNGTKGLLELYKAVIGDFKPEETNEKENEYQIFKLQYKYFTVEGIQIYATSQQHAEQLVEKMIQSGELVRVVAGKESL